MLLPSAFAYNVKNYFTPAGTGGDNILVIGSTESVISGGKLIFRSGSYLQIDAGATVVSTAAVFMDITGAAGLTVTHAVVAGTFYSTGTVSFGGAASVGSLVSAGAVSATTINGTAITGTSFVIGANTLTTSEFAFLDGQNQAVKSTSDVTFDTMTVTNNAYVGGFVSATGNVLCNRLIGHDMRLDAAYEVGVTTPAATGQIIRNAAFELYIGTGTTNAYDWAKIGAQ